MKHRILTLVLALAVMLGLVCATGITASAATASEVTVAGVTAGEDGSFDFSKISDEVEGSAELEDGVLTLNNFHYTGEAETVVYANGDLVIKLVGDNSITNEHYGSVEVFTVSVEGKLTIQGTGSLRVENTGGTTGNSNDNIAIVSEGLEVNCAKLEAIAQSSAKGNSYGIDSGSSAIVLGATSQLIAKGYDAAWTYVDSESNEVSNYLPSAVAFGGADADTHFVNTSTDYDVAVEEDAYDTTESNTYQHIEILPAVYVSIYDSKESTTPQVTKWVYGEEMPAPNHPTVDGCIFMGWYKTSDDKMFTFPQAITENVSVYAKFATYDATVEELNDKIDELETARVALQAAIDNKADATTVADLASNLSNITSEVTEIKTKLDGFVTQDKLDKLEDELLLADGELNRSIATLRDDLNDARDELLKAIADGDTATVNTLTTKLNELETALKDADAALKSELEGAITTAKQEAVDAATALVEAAKTELTTAINTKADQTALDEAVAKLETAIGTAETLAKSYADDKDAALKTELAGAIATAKQEAVDAATALVEAAKNELTTAINTKADQTALDAAVAKLETAIGTAETLAKSYADDKDAALKTELAGAIATAKQEAVDAATALVEAAKTELTTAINTKADQTALDEAVAKLETAIGTAETLAKSYADDKDAALKTELEGAIATAKQEAVEAATTLVNEAKTELEAAIAEKADSATLAAKVEELYDAIEAAEAAANLYADEKDTALKAELEQKIAAGDAAVQAAVDKLEEDVEALRQELAVERARVDANEAKIAELTNQLTTALNNIDTLTTSLADTKAELDALIEEVEAAKQEINTAIENLKSAVEKLQQDVADAITELGNRVTVDDFTSKVEELQKAIGALALATEQAAGELKAELKAYIDAGDAKVQDAVDTLTTYVEDEVARLEGLIAGQIDPDELKAAIESVYADIAALETLLKNADAELKEELEQAIKDAEDRVLDAIDTLRQNLVDEVARLEGLIAGQIDPDELKAAIDGVNANIAALESTLLAADDALRAELLQAIADAENSLNKTINALTDRVDDLEDKLEKALGDVNTNTTDIADLTEQLSDLATKVEGLVTELDGLDITVTNLDAVVQTLKSAQETTDDAIEELKSRVSQLETSLGKITEQLGDKASAVDFEALKTTVTDLQDAVSALESIKHLTEADVQDIIDNANLATNDAVNSLISRVEILEGQLSGLIDENGDPKAVVDAINELQAAIDALDALEHLTTDDVKQLIADANVAIWGAIESLDLRIQALEEDLVAAKTELGTKVSYEEYKEKVEELDKLIQASDKLINNLDGKLTAAEEKITALETTVNSAKDELLAAIEALEERVEALEKELKDMLDDVKTDTDALKAKAAELQEALEVFESLKDTYLADILDLKEQIEDKVGTTKEDIIAYIKAKLAELRAMLEEEVEGIVIEAMKENIVAVLAELGLVTDDQLKSEIDSLQAQIDELKGRVDDLEQDVNKEITTLATLLLAAGTVLSLGAVYFIFGNRFFPVDTRRSYQHVYIKDGVSKVRHTKSEHKK